MEAAEWWERGGETYARRRRQECAELAEMGADLSAVAAPPPIDFDVWPENWAAVLFYCGLRTQWRIAPFGAVLGLDYPGIEAAMRMQRIPAAERPDLFAKLQIMELAGMAVLNERPAKHEKSN